MEDRGVQLQYRLGPPGQSGAEVDNPLFDLLSTLAAAGSIQQAARESGLSYRHLWGSLKSWEETLGEPLVSWARGQPARLTPFAERLLWAEREARVRMAPHIEALRHELERVLGEAFDGSRQVLRIDASHDLALPGLLRLAIEHHRLHVQLRFAGSVDALRSLAQGRCIVAGFHVPLELEPGSRIAAALKPLLKPGRHKLIGCMHREQGLIVAEGNPLGVTSLDDVARRRLRFASREAGSGTRLLTEHLLARSGLDAAALHVATVETHHLAAATAVASGRADVALGLRAAAEGLGFVPQLVEAYYLVCLSDALEQPAVLSLRALLGSPAWAGVVARPGYALAPDAGRVLSLTRALPWWSFRSPRRPLADTTIAP